MGMSILIDSYACTLYSYWSDGIYNGYFTYLFNDRFYTGQQPNIMITDLDMLKQIMVKEFDSFMDHEVHIGSDHS